jgi:hypothetical protein
MMRRRRQRLARVTWLVAVVAVVVAGVVSPGQVVRADEEGPTPEECAQWIREGLSVPPACVVMDLPEPSEDLPEPIDEPEPGASPELPDTEGPGAAPDESTSEPGDSIWAETLDVAGMFFGDREAILLPAPQLARLIKCGGADPATLLGDPEMGDAAVFFCEGMREANRLVGEAEDEFKSRFPNPSPLERDLGRALTRATFIAALEGKDGKPLFPTVLGSLDLIKGFIDRRILYTAPGEPPVPLGERFLGMLMALDVNLWAEPGSQGES